MCGSRLLLKKLRLNITAARIAVLDLFLESQEALSYTFIHHQVPFDRSTIYRTLHMYLRKKLIRLIPTAGEEPLYVLNSLSQTPNLCSPHIAYFQCHHCCKTYCMEDVSVSLKKLPKGYMHDTAIINIQGVCENCLSNRSYYRPAS